MKKTILLSAMSLLGFNSFASTITCVSGQIGSSEGSSTIFNQDDLKKSPEKGVILQNGDSKYLLTISNIYSTEKDGSETVIFNDAMVLSQIKSNANLQSTFSDGKILMFFDRKENVFIMCNRD